MQIFLQDTYRLRACIAHHHSEHGVVVLVDDTVEQLILYSDLTSKKDFSTKK